MRFRGLDLNLLVALQALLDERSVSGAADRLHMTQPAMSQALGRLRSYFGDELLVPSGKAHRLTARALTLVGPVRDALRIVEGAIVNPATFDPLQSTRQFVVHASDYAMAVVLSAAIA